MIAPHLTPAPVGPQEPPTRAATIDVRRSLRGARGSLLWTTGTACAVLAESDAQHYELTRQPVLRSARVSPSVEMERETAKLTELDEGSKD